MSATAAGVGADRVIGATLLARWWSRPTADELDWWAATWPEAAEVAAGLGTGAEEVDALGAAAAAAPIDALLAEYERLLVGPGRAPCPPYESLWRDDQPRREQGRLMGAAAADVVRIYERLGLRVRDGAHELPDHVAVEWEAYAYALALDAAEPAAALGRDHLARWTARFCDAVGAETDEPFYTALAGLTSLWAGALIE